MAPSARVFVILCTVLFAATGARPQPVGFQFPTCSLACLETVIPESVCDLSANTTCICPQADLYHKVEACIEASCTPNEALAVMMIESMACNWSRRSRRYDVFLSLAVVIPAFSMILMRLHSRWVFGGRFEADDFVMMACGVTYTAMQIVNQIAGAVAFGVDTWTVKPHDLALGLKLLYVSESFYIATLALAKVSILIFCLRTFSQLRFRAVAHSVLAFVVLVNAVLLGVQVFQCIPVEANWTAWPGADSGPYRCININHFIVAGAGLNILQEVIIICLPIPTLVRLNLSVRAKLNAIVLFSMGILTVLTSCVRLSFILPLTHSVNISWDYTDGLIWTGIEAAVTVIIPCLPAVRALLIRDLSGPPNRGQRPESPVDGIRLQELG